MRIEIPNVLNFVKKFIVLAAIFSAGATFAATKSQELVQKQYKNVGTFSGHFLAANLALTSRDYINAADYLMYLYIDNPEDADMVESLFVINLINGEFGKARLFAQKYHEELIEEELQQSSHHYLSKLFLAAANLKRGDYKAALDHVEQGDDFMISEMSYNLLSTWINFAAGKTELAKKSLEKLQENSFHKVYYLINSAILAELEDRQKDADNLYNEALLLGGTKLDLIETYGRFLERTDRDKQAFALYDDFENRAGKHPIISKARERLASGDKPEPFVKDAQHAVAYSFYHIANIYLGAGNYDESLNYARLAQYLAPENSYILDVLSQNYQNLGKVVWANEILAKIPKDSPFYTKAQVRIATNLEINGQTDLALAQMLQLVKNTKHNDDVNLQYAHMLKRGQKYADAVQYYDQLIDEIDAPSINDANLYYNRAVSKERLKQWPEAEVDFLQTLTLDPNHSYALNYLGYSWVDKGLNLERGLEMINNALLLDPQNAFIIDSLGWAYFKLGRYDEARIELERALIVTPGNADVSEHLGDVYWKLGRELEAEFKWQAATIFKSPEINYDDLEYKREFGLEALDKRKAKKMTTAESS